MGFDIRTLADFRLPKYRCEHCRGLLFVEDVPWDADECPVCSIPYVGQHSIQRYLKSPRHAVSSENAEQRARSLVAALDRIQGTGYRAPPLRILAGVLARAHSFVHVASRGIDFQMLGMLRIVAERTQVRLLVTAPSANTRKDLTEFQHEWPYGFEARIQDANWSDPHQKVVVVDGLLGITGSANFTTNAWRNAADDRETVHYHTDVAEVAEVNNRYFARHWAEFGPQRSSIDTDVPF